MYYSFYVALLSAWRHPGLRPCVFLLCHLLTHTTVHPVYLYSRYTFHYKGSKRRGPPFFAVVLLRSITLSSFSYQVHSYSFFLMCRGKACLSQLTGKGGGDTTFRRQQNDCGPLLVYFSPAFNPPESISPCTCMGTKKELLYFFIHGHVLKILSVRRLNATRLRINFYPSAD